MTNAMSPTLKTAQEAIAAGNTADATRLLKRCLREDPNDHRPWLWLAGLAKTKQQSLAYLDQAEKLSPGDSTIQKARLWTQQHLPDAAEVKHETTPPIAAAAGAAAKGTAQAPTATGRRTAVRRKPAPAAGPVAAGTAPKRSWFAAALLLLLIAFIVGGAALLLSNRIFPAFALAAAPTNTPLPPELVLVAEAPEEVNNQTAGEAPENETGLPGADPSAIQTPTPAPTRLAPTPTLQPTNTPAPTATIAPTVIVSTGDDPLDMVTVGEGERWVDVNLTTQSLTAYEGATPVFNTLISSGMSGHQTVTGQFHIWMRYESQTMNGYLLGYDYYLEDVPYVMYFYNDYALHGAYWHNNFGTPMSHGCVNLHPSDAEWLFNFTSMGTLVNVHY